MRYASLLWMIVLTLGSLILFPATARAKGGELDGLAETALAYLMLLVGVVTIKAGSVWYHTGKLGTSKPVRLIATFASIFLPVLEIIVFLLMGGEGLFAAGRLTSGYLVASLVWVGAIICEAAFYRLLPGLGLRQSVLLALVANIAAVAGAAVLLMMGVACGMSFR